MRNKWQKRNHPKVENIFAWIGKQKIWGSESLPLSLSEYISFLVWSLNMGLNDTRTISWEKTGAYDWLMIWFRSETYRPPSANAKRSSESGEIIQPEKIDFICRLHSCEGNSREIRVGNSDADDVSYQFLTHGQSFLVLCVGESVTTKNGRAAKCRKSLRSERSDFTASASILSLGCVDTFWLLLKLQMQSVTVKRWSIKS